MVVFKSSVLKRVCKEGPDTKDIPSFTYMHKHLCKRQIYTTRKVSLHCSESIAVRSRLAWQRPYSAR